MKKMLLTVLLLLLLTGCSMPNLMGGKQAGEAPPEEPSLSVNDPEDETPEKPEADRSEVSEPETGKPEEPEAPAEPPSLAAPEADGVKPSGEEETSGSQQQETFDAAQAVTVAAVDGGIQVIFDALPQTAGDRPPTRRGVLYRLPGALRGLRRRRPCHDRRSPGAAAYERH